jgi:hypothetical protein
MGMRATKILKMKITRKSAEHRKINSSKIDKNT